MSGRDSGEWSDQELVRQTQAGDPGAFDQLVLRYEGRIKALLYGILLNHEEAEDAAIETFFKAFRSIAHFRGQAQFSTWLYRIAKNTAYNALRRLRRRPAILPPPPDGDDDLQENFHFIDKNPASDVLRQLGNQELQNKLNECLRLLSEDHRMVVTLFDIQGVAHAEIARIMGCSEGTVRSRLHYAHKQLQQLLKNYK
ncbi:MAG: sigma-70 family RNA polymerase sigma factor [Verrucomicrobium sp.]|nr:sigma-70 family RNA polymerase sigma factor [Verrucomicrobium sp.]